MPTLTSLKSRSQSKHTEIYNDVTSKLIAIIKASPVRLTFFNFAAFFQNSNLSALMLAVMSVSGMIFVEMLGEYPYYTSRTSFVDLANK